MTAGNRPPLDDALLASLQPGTEQDGRSGAGGVATTWRPGGSYALAHGIRLPIVLVLATVDLAGAAGGASMMGPGGGLRLAAAASALVFAAQIAGLYAADCTADLQRSARGTAALGLATLSAAACAAWLANGSAAARHLGLAIASGFCLALLGRLLCHAAALRLQERLMENVLVIGRPHIAGMVVRSGRVLGQKVRFVGQVAIGFPRAHGVEAGGDSTLHESVAAALGLRHPRLDRVVILAAGVDDGQMRIVLRALEALSVPVHILADPPSDDLTAASAWVVRGLPAKPGAMLAKRAFDLMASSMALLFLLPLLALAAIFVRLESPGPALFRQTRLGRDNLPFTVLKFRTMRADAEATDGSVQAVRGDARITRIGAILRRTSMDELPQLFNVLAGSMSLVGPRPHPTELNLRFVPLIERYSARHCMAPGMTGWAQVNGFRGETRTTEQMRRRVELDLEYIHSHSVAWDAWILFRTVVCVVTSRNAY